MLLKKKVRLNNLLRVGYGDEKDATTELLCQMSFPEMTLRLTFFGMLYLTQEPITFFAFI